MNTHRNGFDDALGKVPRPRVEFLQVNGGVGACRGRGLVDPFFETAVVETLGALLDEVVDDRVSRGEFGHEQHSSVAQELALGLVFCFRFELRKKINKQRQTKTNIGMLWFI